MKKKSPTSAQKPEPQQALLVHQRAPIHRQIGSVLPAYASILENRMKLMGAQAKDKTFPYIANNGEAAIGVLHRIEKLEVAGLTVSGPFLVSEIPAIAGAPLRIGWNIWEQVEFFKQPSSDDLIVRLPPKAP